MTDEAEKKSIIDPKYAERYKTKPKDWLGNFLDEQVTTAEMKEKTIKGEDSEEDTKRMVASGKRVLDLDKLFALCEQNSLDTAKMKEQADRKNAPGRIRMTLGNSLRAAARKRHGLFDVDGNWTEADADFIGDSAKTHNADGTKIVVEKPTEDAA